MPSSTVFLSRNNKHVPFFIILSNAEHLRLASTCYRRYIYIRTCTYNSLVLFRSCVKSQSTICHFNMSVSHIHHFIVLIVCVRVCVCFPLAHSHSFSLVAAQFCSLLSLSLSVPFFILLFCCIWVFVLLFFGSFFPVIRMIGCWFGLISMICTEESACVCVCC